MYWLSAAAGMKRHQRVLIGDEMQAQQVREGERRRERCSPCSKGAFHPRSGALLLQSARRHERTPSRLVEDDLERDMLQEEDVQDQTCATFANAASFLATSFSVSLMIMSSSNAASTCRASSALSLRVAARWRESGTHRQPGLLLVEVQLEDLGLVLLDAVHEVGHLLEPL